MPSGTVKIEANASGFKSSVYGNTPYDSSRPEAYNIPLTVGTVTETITVDGVAPVDKSIRSDRDEKKEKEPAQQQASANVFNLQKKVAGVLPVRVDVPRAGASYLFARALVLDEETKLTFSYKTK